MKPSLWFISGLGAIIAAGLMGDAIFTPHPQDFSFRVFSAYTVSVLLLLAACVTLNMRNR